MKMQHSSSNSLAIGSNTSQFLTKNNTRVVSQRGGFAILPCSVTMSTPATVSKYLILIFCFRLLALLLVFVCSTRVCVTSHKRSQSYITTHFRFEFLLNITPGVSSTHKVHPSSVIETFISTTTTFVHLQTNTHKHRYTHVLMLRDAQIIIYHTSPHLFPLPTRPSFSLHLLLYITLYRQISILLFMQTLLFSYYHCFLSFPFCANSCVCCICLKVNV